MTEILKWTPDGYIYYMSTMPDQPGVRHLFRIRDPQSSKTKKPELFSTSRNLLAFKCIEYIIMPVILGSNDVKEAECVTCQRKMKELNRKDCQYYDVQMSKEGSFMTMICQGPDIPYACIHHTPSSHYIMTWEVNQRLENTLDAFDMPNVQYLQIPVSESDQKAQVKLLLPPDFDSSHQYPLVVYAYGGPGFQSVTQKFDWNEMGAALAGSAEVIYAIVDPRGSGYQGDDWRFAIYRRFGTAEVQSLTEVAKHLQVRIFLISLATQITRIVCKSNFRRPS